MTGLKLNALLLITGQVRNFQLSQVQLERVNREILQTCSFDCSLQELLRLENTIDLLQHYNLLLPTQHPFGSTAETLPIDCYDVDIEASAVVNTLLYGAYFERRMLNSRAQKSRFLSVSPTLDRLCFSRQGEEVDQEFSLQEVVVCE